MVTAGTMHTQIVSSSEGVWPPRNLMLSRKDVEVRRGAICRNLPKTEGARVVRRSPVRRCCYLPRRPSFSGYECGGPVSRRAARPKWLKLEGLLCTLILVVKEV